MEFGGTHPLYVYNPTMFQELLPVIIVGLLLIAFLIFEHLWHATIEKDSKDDGRHE